MARLARLGAVLFIISSVATSMSGCSAPVDDAERFREAVPAQDDVTLGVPEKAQGTSTRTQGLHVLTGDTGTNTARYYQLTPAGRKQLGTEISEFEKVTQAILRVIQPA